MTTLRTVLAAAVALALAACASRPADPRADVQMPAAWHASAATTGAPAPGPWWSAFGSPELDRLMAAALEGNRDLQAAGSRIAQARALARVAGAELLPTLDVNLDAVGERTGGVRTTTHSAGLGLSFEPDLSGRLRASRSAAERRVLSSVHAQREVALALQAEVANTYFRVLSAQDRLKVARQNLDIVDSMLRLLRTQHDAGAISRLEVVRQQGLVATVRAGVAPLEQERQQALDALAVLLGRPVQELTVEAGSLEALRLPPVAAGLPSELLVQRPDIRRAESDLAAADADIGAARAALLPSLRLTAAGGVESASLASLLRGGHAFHLIAASLAAPIFDGGRLRGQVQLTEARREELLHAYRQAILVGLREVEDSLTALQRLAEQSVQQQEVVARAADALDLADLRWRNGAVDFATVLDAQRVRLDALAAQQQVTLARYAATVDLHRALGGGGIDAGDAHAAADVSDGAHTTLSRIAPHVAHRMEKR